MTTYGTLHDMSATCQFCNHIMHTNSITVMLEWLPLCARSSCNERRFVSRSFKKLISMLNVFSSLGSSS